MLDAGVIESMDSQWSSPVKIGKQADQATSGCGRELYAAYKSLNRSPEQSGPGTERLNELVSGEQAGTWRTSEGE